jgi:hypothetical protein
LVDLKSKTQILIKTFRNGYETHVFTPMAWIVPEHRKAIDPDKAEKHWYSTTKAGEIPLGATQKLNLLL